MRGFKIPIASKEDITNPQEPEISLITEGESLIKARITLFCPSCKTNRKFKNVFSKDKIGLIIVTLKIIDWLTCDDCGDLLDSKIEYEI